MSKKKLKKIAGALAAGLGAAALMKRRKQNRQMKDYLSTEGGDRSSILGPLQDNSFLMNDGFIEPGVVGDGMAAKGGSAGRKKRSTITGVAVRGFGRALKGKK